MASAIYAVAISQAAASDTWSTWSSIVSNAQIKLTNNYGPGSWWLVIGKQQWGYATRSGKGDTTFSFPLTFNTVYAVNAGRYFKSRDDSNSGHGVMSHTTTNCVTYTGASQTSAMTIIAIGKQQWGVTTYSGCGNCFPISFTTPYAVIAEEHHKTTTATNYDGSFMTTRLTTTGFSYRAESTGYADAIMFVSFGKQRSGERLTLHQILPLLLPFL